MVFSKGGLPGVSRYFTGVEQMSVGIRVSAYASKHHKLDPSLPHQYAGSTHSLAGTMASTDPAVHAQRVLPAGKRDELSVKEWLQVAGVGGLHERADSHPEVEVSLRDTGRVVRGD